MDKKIFHQIQNQIIRLLKRKNKPLYLLAKDNCSELSRLTGCLILEKIKSRVFIIKGEGVMINKNQCHDVLLIECNKRYYLVDPTVWQFFKYKRNILIGEVEDVKSALDVLIKIYKGKWKVSEELKKNSCAQKNKWKKIIEQNIDES